MRQSVYNGGNIVGGASGANVSSETLWQGGDGWIVVDSFIQISGTSGLNVHASASGGLGTPLLGVPVPIVTAGAYPFYAPKDTKIYCEISLQPGDQVSFSSIYLQGDA